MGIIIATLLMVHFVADFLLQSREMGTKKSSELKWLMAHLAIQFIAFVIILSPLYGLTGIVFAALNAVIHGVIDWNIWRGYKWSVARRLYDEQGNPWVEGKSKGFPLHSLMSDVDHSFIPPQPPQWRYWLDHWFYATIGFDQLLHALTLILLAGILL